MSDRPRPPDEAADLRRRAEERAREHATPAPEELAALSPEAARQVLHELRVHQIELELQNEELRQAQAELEASRARYFDLYELAPVGYVTMSEAGLILTANLTIGTLLVVARSALLRQPFSHFILPEDQDVYYRHHQQLFRTGAPLLFELQLRRADGAPLWARVEATAGEDADGAPVCRAVVSDITKQKRAVEVAEQRQRFIEAILEHAPIGFAVTTIDDGVAQFVSARFEEIYGLPHRAVKSVGQLFDKAYPDPAYREPLRARILADIASGDLSRMRWENLVVTSTAGERRVVSASCIPLVEQNLLVSTVQDVTEQYRAEQARRASGQQLRLLTHNVRDLLWLMDLSFRPTWISPSVIQARGYSLEELAELPLDRHLTPESLACMRALTAVHLTPERLADPTCAISVAAELELYRKDGSTMWADSVITLVRDRDGQPTMLLGVGRDITDRKRVEEPVR